MKAALRYLIVVLVLLFARPAGATIGYHISLKNPDQHELHVSMQIPASDSDHDLVVAIPAWYALYQVRDFGYRVRDVRATESSAPAKPLAVQKLDKQTWKISVLQTASSVTDVVYTIEWEDPGPFNSQLDDHHAFINFAEVLMYVPTRRAEDTTVQFDDVPDGWRAIAELPQGATPNTFTAAGYDKLVDAPTEIGKFDEFAFDEGGAHFRVVVDGNGWRRDRLQTNLQRITKYEMQMMGGPPFTEYTFFFHFGPYPEVGGGGMEHANCTAIAASTVESATSIAAHEFFHAWNVKRIRPQSLEPVDFTKEMYTRALWFAEGVTSTYGAYTLERTGLWTKDQFYGDLAGQISELDSRPAHTWQSVEESSLDAWLEKYDDYRRPDRSISYYNKGQILGVLLDLQIRNSTDNHKSLDDVLRRMYAVYAQQAQFYPDSVGVLHEAAVVAEEKFDDFYHDFVAGTDNIPYQDFLDMAGLELKVEMHKSADLGFWTVAHGPGAPIQVSQVVPGTTAEAAGLKSGDILLAINGGPVPRYLPGWLHDQTPGEKITLHVHRDDKELDIKFALGANDSKRFWIAEMATVTEKQRRIREGWLKGTTN
jgi:predicted metalloprotease with PDZ domain